MLTKTSFAILPAALVVAMAAVGPRSPPRRPALWGAAVIAGAMAAPNLLWQSQHGWPQLEMARVIAASASRLDYVLLVWACAGLLLVPVTIAGVFRLLRGTLSPYRFVAVAWIGLVVVYLLARGKGYYTAGLVPALAAAGGISVDGWLDRGRVVLRHLLLGIGLLTQAALSALVGLPLVPPAALAATPLPAVSGEIGSQLGWPALVDDVRDALSSVPPTERGRAVVFTANYGEAAALTLLGGSGMPPVHSGHNGFATWGPPADDAAPVVLVGIGDAYAAEHFVGCRVTRPADNGVGVDTQEQGIPVRVCERPARPWSLLWPELAHLS